MGLITANSDVTGAIVLLLSLCVTRATSTGLYTYPFGFFNTSTPNVINGTEEYGIVQISACNAAPSGIAKMIIAFGNSSFSENAQLGEFLETYDVYSALKLTAERIPGSHNDLKYGVDISSDSQIFVYGIKSDVGSTDGFLVPPLTVNSTEFFIAGWKNPELNISDVGESGIIVAGAFPDTCVEIYRITDGNKYKRLYHDIYLQEDLWMSQIVFNDTEETTGLYVNSSKPINVFSSVSCAMINRPPCDYMVEQILPVANLGTKHIVPPIAGRASWAGYIVRVVATQPDTTTVTWGDTLTIASYPNGTNVTSTGIAILKRAEFVHINVTGKQTSSLEPLLVTCSQKCVVMQYNKGNAAVSGEPSRTDPFMMLVVPVDHFVDASCFRTAKLVTVNNISDPDAGYNSNGDFDNYISVVIKSSKRSSILLDGAPFQANWSTVGDYSAGYTWINGSYTHTIRTTDGTLFEAYIYGHSLDNFTTVGYGFPISYKLEVKDFVTGYEPPPNITRGLPPVINYCLVDNVSTGSLVFSRSNEIVVDTLNLVSNLSFAATPSLTQACKDTYLEAFLDLVRNVFREINSRLCEGLLCPYLLHNNKTGIVVPSSDDANPTTVFVAFDVEFVNSSVSINAQQNGGTVYIQLPYAGFYDTEIESFAACRGEIRELLSNTSNWFLYGYNSTNWQRQLLPTPANCPSMTFSYFTDWIPPCNVWY